MSTTTSIPSSLDDGGDEDDVQRSPKPLRVAILGVTFLFVVAALAISCALVIYTAYRHELQNGIFALLLAVLSAQIAINWFLWKDDEE